MNTRRIAGALAVLAAAVFCALAAHSYAQARDDDTLAQARARDTVRTVGQEEIGRLNSVDAQHVEDWLRERLDATSGPLHDQMRRSTDSDRTALQQSGASARGTVTDAAVTALDRAAGTAKLIATVDVLVTPKAGGGTPSTDRKRFEATLDRTADGWRITTLTAVPVADSGPGATAPGGMPTATATATATASATATAATQG
ncbi:hypothetical protein [Kitasatospora sp. NBC_00315]|uniref:hypothetical protein n=1 Tax=Kitasatospora sp. NBC_00315 TaxID=2975963 RepID=UPI00352DCAAB